MAKECSPSHYSTIAEDGKNREVNTFRSSISAKSNAKSFDKVLNSDYRFYFLKG